VMDTSGYLCIQPRLLPAVLRGRGCGGKNVP
jgi:hypothetical protein